jgi:hypothetical protein
MSDWKCLASFGEEGYEETVRTYFEEQAGEVLLKLRRDLLAEGFEGAAVDMALEAVETHVKRYVERTIERVLRNMRLTAGAAHGEALH